jgi:hypothetical protein
MKLSSVFGIACLSVLVATGGAAQVKDVDYSWAEAVLPSGAEFTLEIADDPQSRWRGYRYREHVADDEGMLFIFAREQPVSFEMKDCLVSLDMIFLDSKMQVVEIAHDRQPCPEGESCPPIAPMRNAQYVLELAGGTASREGLKPGDRITVLSEPSIP